MPFYIFGNFRDYKNKRGEGIKDILKKLKKMGYVVLVKHNVWIIKEIYGGKVIKEIYGGKVIKEIYGGKVIKEIYAPDLEERNLQIKKNICRTIKEKI